MRATCARSSGDSEITLWCERTLQGGRNSGRVVATIEQRRLRAALGERAHEIERGRVGPVQVLEGEHDRLRPRARQNPGRHRRQLPAPQFLRREFRPRGPPAAGRRPAARAGAHIRPGRGRPAAECSRGRRGAVRRAGPRRTAGGPIRRSGAAACSATAATTTIRPRCAASRRAGRETPRSAATCRGPARRRSARAGPRPARARSQRRPRRSSSSSRPTSGVSARAPPRRPPPLARTMR